MDNQSGNSINKKNFLSDDHQDNHGKKARFNHNDYYVKKWNLREKNNAQIRNSKKVSKKWQFQNCCSITIDDKVSIRPNQVFSALKESLSDFLVDIIAIGQFSSSKFYTVKFKDKASYDANLGKLINLADIAHTLEDANLTRETEKAKPDNKYTMTCFFRIHWLPSGFKDQIKEFIKEEAKFLTVMEVKSETWEEGKSTIENGVYSVKVKYDIDDNTNFLNFAGYHHIDGCGALIIINGTPSKCLQCHEWGHMRRDCPKNSKKCTSCNKAGHEASSCWSNQAKASADLDDGDLIDDETVTNKEIIITDVINETSVSNKPFKLPNLQDQTTVNIKKENLDKVQATINSVASGRQRSTSTSSESTPKLLDPNTFNKIKASINSSNNNNNNKTKQTPKNQNQKYAKKVQEANKEFIEMNAAALKASQQFKRANSKSDLHEQNKKPLVGDDMLD